MRYFFHVRDRKGVIADEEGSEHPDIASALGEARVSAGDFITDNLRGGLGVVGRAIEIADAEGHVLETLRIVSVLTKGR